ncbi:uncharacterized protein LODBEIA_P08130 [Lodderomyces beijingensis]|uniref:VPS37 C-terminal domain-containing protein n=1 Tax=Lodderomyces beijingensis TaxID=1775926 RepID=A0ABP0ZFG4_9ASCO
MASMRKIDAYMDRKNELITEYTSLEHTLSDEPDPSRLLNNFAILKRLDELRYEYYVAKSYRDNIKSGLESAVSSNSMLLSDIEVEIRKLEEVIGLDELVTVAPQLQIVRKGMAENAHEAGRLIYNYEVQNKEKWKLLDQRMYELRQS